MQTSKIEPEIPKFGGWNRDPLFSFENSNASLPCEAGMIHCLRTPADQPGPDGETTLLEKEAEEQSPEEEEFILCRQCRQAITRPDDRLTIQGAHRHTFANPHGIVFDIGCFRSVIGCGYAGAASDEFTWFAGYHWRVCYCAMCLTHLGWIFGSMAGHTFHGLIVDKLIEPG
jgi:hypothetical protein